ncbi:MAG TPA: type II toxin-antitoxin system VapC family toxin [Longimicrobium sp.]|jgi:tRNA(fMet)-specific endonuclease VapC
MVGKILLDTNFVIDLLRGSQAAQSVVTAAEQVYVPATVMGELFHGAEVSDRREAQMAKAEEFASRSNLLPCDLETARHYGGIRGTLRRRGKPIPENDIWIAALAQQHDLAVATKDAHFRQVDALPLLSW